MKKLLAIVLALLTITPSLQADQTSEQQIIDNIHAMWKAVETDNLKAYLKHIHPDYSVFGEGDAYLHKGKDKEAIDYADYMQRSDRVRTFMHQPAVTIKGDTAWITYYWNDAGYISGERFTSRGKSTRIFVKVNDQWLCIHSHFTELP